MKVLNGRYSLSGGSLVGSGAEIGDSVLFTYIGSTAAIDKSEPEPFIGNVKSRRWSIR